MALLIVVGYLVAQEKEKRIDTDRIESVTFFPVTLKGETSRVTVKVLSDKTGRDFSVKCNGETCRDLSAGEYRFELVLEPSKRVEKGSAYLRNRREWITVSLGPTLISDAELEGSTLHGLIRGVAFGGGGPFWIRFKPLYTSGIRDSSAAQDVLLSEDGRFEVSRILPGKWLILVFRKTDLIHSSVHTISDPSVEFRLTIQ